VKAGHTLKTTLGIQSARPAVQTHQASKEIYHDN